MSKDKQRKSDKYIAILKVDVYSKPYGRRDLVNWIKIYNDIHGKSGMRIKLVTFKKIT